jgi:cell division protein FtsL
MAVIHDDDDALLNDDDDLLTDDESSELEPTETEPSPSAASSPSEPEPKADEEDEETLSYGKRVQKRISKLTAKMREMEQETAQWKSKVEELESKTKLREVAEFQGHAEWSVTEINKQIDAARAAKRAAIEEGDVDRQLQIDEQILDLREQLSERKRIATAAKEQATQLQNTPRPQPPAPAPATIPDHLPTGTKQWLRANPWFMKGSDPRAVEFARTLDAALQEEGYSPDDPSMYVELDKRLQVLAPRLAKPAKTPPKPKVAGSSVDGMRTESASAKPGRKLTTADLEKMSRYGFNPKDPQHRKNWLRRFDPL